MKKIIVEDNFFETKLANLIEKGVQAYEWHYGHRSDYEDPAHNKFFVCHLWSGSSENNFFHLLWKLLHNRVPAVADYHCSRIIANGQVKGQDGNWHADHGDKTVLYFPLEWATQWGGSAYFEIDGSETEMKYKKNRLIIFDSDIPHYGSGPAIDNILRVSIAFNLRIRAEQ